TWNASRWTFVHLSPILIRSAGDVRCITLRFYGSDPPMASFTRRFVSVLSGSALAFSLVSVPAAVVATAAAQAECSTSGSGNWSGYTVTSSWLDSTAAPGGQATLRSTITGPG